MSSLSERVAGSIYESLAQRDLPRIGPFTVLRDASSANVWRNYAIPDAGAQPSAADVAALIAYFHEHGRVPRLEYVPAAAPAVEQVLIAAGFQVEGRPPLMACRPGELVATALADGVTIMSATSHDDLYDTAHVQNLAYASSEPTSADDVARLANLVSQGGVVVLARDAGTGAAVGGGLVTAPVDGVSELAAVGVIESHRRRGIASAVTAALTTAAHERGAQTVWLEPAGEREQAIYERAGFRADGAKLWISMPASTARPVDFDHAHAAGLTLVKVGADTAQAMLDGDLSMVTGAPGWPHENTMAGLWMVANQGAELWLALLDGAVIGEGGTLGPVDEGGAVQIGYGFSAEFTSAGHEAALASALSELLRARPGVTDVVDVMSAAPDASPPRLDAAEADTLLAFISYLRDSLIGKVAGLSEDDARHSPVGSGTSLLGLLKHVAHIEVFWLHQAYAGRDSSLMPDDRLVDADTIAALTDAYQAVAKVSDEIVRATPDITTKAVAAGFDAAAPTLRWILTHLVEEIGRHAGHADILRELIDGSTGR